jgi:hypothetical protein
MDIIRIQLTINDVLVVIIKILYHEHDDEKVKQWFDDLNKVDLRTIRECLIRCEKFLFYAVQIFDMIREYHDRN